MVPRGCTQSYCLHKCVPWLSQPDTVLQPSTHSAVQINISPPPPPLPPLMWKHTLNSLWRSSGFLSTLGILKVIPYRKGETRFIPYFTQEIRYDTRWAASMYTTASPPQPLALCNSPPTFHPSIKTSKIHPQYNTPDMYLLCVFDTCTTHPHTLHTCTTTYTPCTHVPPPTPIPSHPHMQNIHTKKKQSPKRPVPKKASPHISPAIPKTLPSCP